LPEKTGNPSFDYFLPASLMPSTTLTDYGHFAPEGAAIGDNADFG
jgi:hypothetical protein